MVRNIYKWHIDTAIGVFKRHQFIRYLFSGGTAATIDVGLLFVLVKYFHVYYLAAATFAMTMSFIVRFLLQKFVTFQNTDEARATKQLVLYSFMCVSSVIITNILLYVCVDIYNINVVKAQIFIIFSLACISFFIYRIFIFAKPAPVRAIEIIE